MEVHKTPIPGLLVIKPRVFADNRGYFFESFNERAFQQHHLHYTFVQDNESKSGYGVLRGLHYQVDPFAQTKLVRVTSGEVLDVAVDLRPDSATYGHHFSIRLSGENKFQFLVPKGFAHGYVVLSETAIFNYKCDQFYSKEHEGGIRYDDAKLNIDWILPSEAIQLSDKDKIHPSFGQHRR